MVGCSLMDERAHRRGRPYGGCAILWNSDVTFTAKEEPTGTDSACAVVIELTPTVKLLLVNVYMPFDDGKEERYLAQYSTP